MLAVVVHLGDIIAALVVAVLLLVLGVGYWCDRRAKRKRDRRRGREGWRP